MVKGSNLEGHGRFGAPVKASLIAISLIIGFTSLISLLLLSWRPTVEYSDFAQDYVSSRAWADGIDPYANTPDLIRRYEPTTVQLLPDRHHNPHTPFQILLARPFSTLPFRTASAIWLIIETAALVSGAYLVLRTLLLSSGVAIGISCSLLALPTVRLALANGEPNAIALLFLVLAWIALRRDRQKWAGIYLGLATALRVFPILMVIPLIRKRAFRALGWQLGSALVISAGSGLILGVHATWRFVTYAAPSNFRYWRAAAHNLSLLAIPYRWLTYSHWSPRGVNVPALATLLAVGVLAACLWAAASTPARVSKDVFWATVPWAIVASPLAWADYLILVLPVIIVLFVRASSRLRAFLVVPAALTMIGRPYFVHVVNPVGTVRQLLVLSLPLYGVLVLTLLEWTRSTRGSDIALSEGPAAIA